MPSVLKSEQFDVGNGSEVGVDTSIVSGSSLGEIQRNISSIKGMINRVHIMGRFRQGLLCRIISVAMIKRCHRIDKRRPFLD